MTSARDQRNDGEGPRLKRLRQDPVLLSAPPLNAANDNDSGLRLVADEGDTVTSFQLSGRAPLGATALIVICVATGLLMAAGWLLVISMTLLDSIKWALS